MKDKISDGGEISLRFIVRIDKSYRKVKPSNANYDYRISPSFIMQIEPPTSTMGKYFNDNVPEQFMCPLTLEIMNDPLMDRHGRSYERTAILEWIVKQNSTCPMTRQPLQVRDLIPNHKLRKEIFQWKICQGDDTASVDTFFDESNVLREEAIRALDVWSANHFEFCHSTSASKRWYHIHRHIRLPVNRRVMRLFSIRGNI